MPDRRRLHRSVPRQPHRGFTLLEVLAALVIVSLGMLGVIEAVSQTARNGAHLRDKSIAHWIAMNQLTLARLGTQPPKLGKSSDDVEMANRHWRWTMEVKPTPLESVRRIEVRVRLAEADEDSSLTMVTGFFGTAIAQPGSTVIMWQGANQPAPSGSDDNKDDNPQDQPPKNPTPEPEPPPEPVDPPEPPPDAGQ